MYIRVVSEAEIRVIDFFCEDGGECFMGVALGLDDMSSLLMGVAFLSGAVVGCEILGHVSCPVHWWPIGALTQA